MKIEALNTTPSSAFELHYLLDDRWEINGDQEFGGLLLWDRQSCIFVWDSDDGWGRGIRGTPADVPEEVRRFVENYSILNQ